MSLRVIFFAFLFHFSANAALNQDRFSTFLKNGFDMQNYQKCVSLFPQCSKKMPLPDESCIDKITKDNSVCFQLKKLSTALGSVPAMLVAKEAGAGFVMIDQVFSADGQDSYYIISPTGYIVNTNVDPRSLSPTLKKQYLKADWMILNNAEPQLFLSSNGTHQFVVQLKITKICLACEVVGYADVQFDFSKQGTLTKTSLKKFKPS